MQRCKQTDTRTPDSSLSPDQTTQSDTIVFSVVGNRTEGLVSVSYSQQTTLHDRSVQNKTAGQPAAIGSYSLTKLINMIKHYDMKYDLVIYL